MAAYHIPPPNSGPIAKLSFIGGTNSYINDSPLSGQSCITTPIVSGKNMREQTIAAGKRIWIGHGIETGGTSMGQTCLLSYSFVPEMGIRYTSKYQVNNNRCTVYLFRQAYGQAVSLEYSFQREKNCW